MHFTITSGGRTIRIDAIEPASAAGPLPALILLHGAGGHSAFWLGSIAPLAAQLQVSVYAIHYFDRTSTTRADAAMLTGGRYVPQWLETIRDAVEAISRRTPVNPDRIALVGISLGAFLSLALAAQGIAVRAIVEVSGGLVPPFQALAPPAFPPVLIVHGQQDTVVPVSMAHALDATLARLGIPHQTELFDAEGHWFSPAAQISILAAISTFLRRHL